VREWGVAETPLTFEQAVAWLSSHPVDEPHFIRFNNQASELGDEVVPGMIEVLAKGPIRLHRAAAWVLAYHDFAIATHGSTVGDFEYRLSRPNRPLVQIVRPQHLTAADITEDALITAGPILTDAKMKRFYFQYLVMFGVVVALDQKAKCRRIRPPSPLSLRVTQFFMPGRWDGHADKPLFKCCGATLAA
jgi:hypothetical protein